MSLSRIICHLLLIMFFFTGWSCSQEEEASQEYYLFVGTYTQKSDEGIHVYKFNPDDESLTHVSSTEAGIDPSYLTISSDHEYLYAVNEYRYSDESGGEVSSFSFNKDDGTLSFINRVSSEGNSPCYISLDQTGQYAFVTNYMGGSFSMLPINNDGSLESATATVQHEGSGVNEMRQEAPHLHCAYPTPDNQSVIVNDLGTDRVTQYAFNAAEGTLDGQPVNEYDTEPGAGPRHLTFHPNGKYAYLVNELNGTVEAFKYIDGILEPFQTISTVPDNFEGPMSGADIHVSPDGAFLYASNREDLNNIVSYSIDRETGELTRAGQHASGGVHPRNFIIDPGGNFLFAANQVTDNVVVFRRNQETGELSPTGTELEVSQPVCLKMIPVK